MSILTFDLVVCRTRTLFYNCQGVIVNTKLGVILVRKHINERNGCHLLMKCNMWMEWNMMQQNNWYYFCNIIKLWKCCHIVLQKFNCHVCEQKSFKVCGMPHCSFILWRLFIGRSMPLWLACTSHTYKMKWSVPLSCPSLSHINSLLHDDKIYFLAFFHGASLQMLSSFLQLILISSLSEWNLTELIRIKDGTKWK